MLYFLLLPLWAVAVLFGLLLLFFRRVRVLGVYLISASTLGLIVSFAASTAAIFGYGWLQQHEGWSANTIVFLLVYLAAAGGGGVLGVLLGAAIVWLVRRRRGAIAAP